MSVIPVAPLRDDPLIDGRGYAELPAQKFFEDLQIAIEEIEDGGGGGNVNPTYTSITSADSPYIAVDNEYILANMGGGDIVIGLPDSGRVHISREGASNTLTISATVNGVSSPTVDSDGEAVSLAYITEWRFL